MREKRGQYERKEGKQAWTRHENNFISLAYRVTRCLKASQGTQDRHLVRKCGTPGGVGRSMKANRARENEYDDYHCGIDHPRTRYYSWTGLLGVRGGSRSSCGLSTR